MNKNGKSAEIPKPKKFNGETLEALGIRELDAEKLEALGIHELDTSALNIPTMRDLIKNLDLERSADHEQEEL